MAYAFDFGAVFDYSGQLAQGAAFTLGLTAAGAVLGGVIGVAGGVCRAWRIAPLNWLFKLYVEAIRNTPFLVQLMFVFFGLPSLGLQLNEWQACLLTTVVNLGAYLTEIVRAGIQETPRGQLEAASALGMGRWACFRHVVLRPALQKVWPALSSQIVIVMLGTSVVSQIAAQDLTFAANFIQSRNFRAFETYIVVTALYFALALLLRQALAWIGQHVIVARRTPAAAPSTPRPAAAPAGDAA
ncbi:amino acid ABC transporter permease [Paracidovorax cattleyae]|uniref:Amino acid ABC transporter membrane protein 1, PAAT family n=2 Tax=Paracidovorax cattleyae TaxID=80868 RepID=A0A1H0V2V7_9BURK|nr:amino acid ABC transporter permease [Paracidovorax cattleyae]AVS72786.1 amino acid ABC transporter permease [Paracidovorax cattleyae]SDP72518.1 amino acid ABC transporter membrane protein 1, PAAT family [Paracidovorax cattleyae]